MILRYKRLRFKKLIDSKGMESIYKHFYAKFTLKTALKFVVIYYHYLKEFRHDEDIEDKHLKWLGWLSIGTLVMEIILYSISLIWIHWLLSFLLVFVFLYMFFYITTIVVNVFEDMADIEITKQEKRNHKLGNIL
jgi:hypothetical protein